MLVRNRARGTDFAALEQSGEQARAIGLGAKIVSVRSCDDSAIQKIDINSSSSLARHHTDSPIALGLMDRQRVKMWLRDVSPRSGRRRGLSPQATLLPRGASAG